MTEDQIVKQREMLMEDLNEVIRKHRVHVGCGMISTDVLGVIEAVKLGYYMSEINYQNCKE